MINVTKIIRNAIIANNITDEVNVFNYTIDDHFHEKLTSLLFVYIPYRSILTHTLMITRFQENTITKLMFGGLKMNRTSKQKKLLSYSK